MGSDDSHFNVSLIVKDKITRQYTGHNFWMKRRGEADLNRGASVYQPNTLPLGQTGVIHRAALQAKFMMM